MEKFIHLITGSVNTMTGWIISYSLEELQNREKTAEECFTADLYVTLFPVTKKYGRK